MVKLVKLPVGSDVGKQMLSVQVQFTTALSALYQVLLMHLPSIDFVFIVVLATDLWLGVVLSASELKILVVVAIFHMTTSLVSVVVLDALPESDGGAGTNGRSVQHPA